MLRVENVSRNPFYGSQPPSKHSNELLFNADRAASRDISVHTNSNSLLMRFKNSISNPDACPFYHFARLYHSVTWQVSPYAGIQILKIIIA